MSKSLPLLESVLEELQARKGAWPEIAKTIEPGSWESYYSWLTKLAQGRIPDPSVNKIQRLADHFHKVSRATSSPSASAPDCS